MVLQYGSTMIVSTIYSHAIGVESFTCMAALALALKYLL
jgi:hypothetical protein